MEGDGLKSFPCSLLSHSPLNHFKTPNSLCSIFQFSSSTHRLAYLFFAHSTHYFIAMVYNVILFGESGVGKSSILNMLSKDYHRAPISNGARGCTFESTAYDVTFKSSTFNIFDTAGLDEGDAGRVPKTEAIVQLYNLVANLKDGLSLLVFCLRAPRIKKAARDNWRLFYDVMCRKKVPIVIAITGLEQEEVMDDWWYKNAGTFEKYRMSPAGVACITATRGKKTKKGTYQFQEEYEESQKKMWKLIKGCHLENPWKVEPVEWFKEIVTVEYRSRACRDPKEIKSFELVKGEGLRLLVKKCGMSEKDALELAEKLTPT